MIQRNFRFGCTLLILSLVFPLLFSSCGAFKEELPPAMNPEVGDRGGLYINGIKTESLSPERESASYLSMNDMQKKLYSAAYTAIVGFNTEFRITGIDVDKYMDEFSAVLGAFLYDFPEFFWLDGNIEAKSDYMEMSKIGNVSFIFGVFDNWKDMNVKDDYLYIRNEIEKLATEVSVFDNDYDRIKAVHDALIRRIEYDYYTLSYEEYLPESIYGVVNSVYGPLVEGRAFCGGYAITFQAVMIELGIPCEYIPGTALDESHAWNKVKIDEDYYNIDLTWDDYDGEPCELVYDYFCLSDEDISKTHIPDAGYQFPSAASDEYNYYSVEGLIFDNYNFDAVNALFAESKSTESISFRFAEESAYLAAVAELIDGEGYKDFEGYSQTEGCTYVTNENLYILTFVLN